MQGLGNPPHPCLCGVQPQTHSEEQGPCYVGLEHPWSWTQSASGDLAHRAAYSTGEVETPTTRTLLPRCPWGLLSPQLHRFQGYRECAPHRGAVPEDSIGEIPEPNQDPHVGPLQ